MTLRPEICHAFGDPAYFARGAWGLATSANSRAGNCGTPKDIFL